MRIKIVALLAALLMMFGVALGTSAHASEPNRSGAVEVTAALPAGCAQKASDLRERKRHDDGEFTVSLKCKDGLVAGMGIPSGEYRRCLTPLSGLFRTCPAGKWTNWKKAEFAGSMTYYDKQHKVREMYSYWAFDTVPGSYRYEGRATPEVSVKRQGITIRIKSSKPPVVAGNVSNRADRLND